MAAFAFSALRLIITAHKLARKPRNRRFALPSAKMRPFHSRASAAAVAAQLVSASSHKPLAATPAAGGPAASTAADAPASPSLPLPDLRCLNGLRALASVAVVLFHCWLGLWTTLVPFEAASTLSRHHWFVRLASVGGPLGVECFLIVTALLAVYQLLPLVQGTGKHSPSSGSAAPPSPWRVVLGYWRRRALRLLPAYAATNLLILFALGPAEGLSKEAAIARHFSHPAHSCPAALWRNVLFVTNEDVFNSCGIHLWSLSLQVQFYLACPLLMLALRPRAPGFRARLAAALGATFAAGTAWRLWLSFSSPGLSLPIGDTIGDPAELARYGALLDAGYFPTGTRVAELALGALLGLLLRTPCALSWLARRRALLSGAALALQAVFVHSILAWPPHGVPGEAPWQPLSAQLYTALAYWGSSLTASAVCSSLLALFLHSDPLHSAASSALSSKLFLPLASLSYCLYLIHEPARLWAILALLPAGMLPQLLAAAPVAGLLFLAAFTLAAGYAAAWVLHRLVEQRF